jgi:hypothetical protein
MGRVTCDVHRSARRAMHRDTLDSRTLDTDLMKLAGTHGRTSR